MNATRRTFLGTGSAAFLALLFQNPLKANKTLFNSPSFIGNFEALRRNVGFFTGRGGTMGWLINSNGVAVIDSQFPPSAKELIAEIEKQKSGSFDILINTHHHGDHTSGNIAFAEKVNTIIAHENSRLNQMRVAKERGREAEQAYPNMTFSDHWKMEIGDEIISSSYHGRGHTNGDIITHFENANVAHLGDLIFNRRFPYIDKGAGAHIGNWINILDHCSNYFDQESILIFGHSGEGYPVVGNIDDVKAFKNYLENLLQIVEKEVEAGKSLDELKSMYKDIPGAPEWKGDGVSRSLDAAFLEITTKK